MQTLRRSIQYMCKTKAVLTEQIEVVQISQNLMFNLGYLHYLFNMTHILHLSEQFLN